MQKRKNKYTIVSRSIRDAHEKPWSIHDSGCVHTTRDKFEHRGRLHIVPGDITDLDLAIDWWISTAPQGAGWYPDQVEVHFCLKGELDGALEQAD